MRFDDVLDGAKDAVTVVKACSEPYEQPGVTFLPGCAVDPLLRRSG